MILNVLSNDVNFKDCIMRLMCLILFLFEEKNLTSRTGNALGILKEMNTV